MLLLKLKSLSAKNFKHYESEFQFWKKKKKKKRNWLRERETGLVIGCSWREDNGLNRLRDGKNDGETHNSLSRSFNK